MMNQVRSVNPQLYSIKEFEEHAQFVLPHMVIDYFNGGSTGEDTLRNNKEIFRKLRIRPRCLVDAKEQDLKTEILGQKVNIPVGISPTAMQKLAHFDGEIGNARAIGSYGGVYILSTISTTSIEDVARGAPDTIKWYQLYIFKDRKVSEELVKRAENAEFKALVLTVDANVFGVRYRDERNGLSLPSHLKLSNFEGFHNTATFSSLPTGGVTSTESLSKSGISGYASKFFDPSITWSDVKWLKSITKLPVIVKGILTKEDAILAIQHGANAIMVSNHGGRQLDSVPAAIEALPEIAAAVGNKIDVYIDGGIRFGTDIFKCLALGAKMVFFGRPAVWGLAHSGEAGVKRVLEILIKELKISLALTGCKNLHEIQKNMVVHESYYSKF